MLTRSAADDGQRRRTPAPAPAVALEGRVLPGAGVPVQGAARD